MSYKFTKDCEIMNCEFLEGEIVEENAVQFYPSVMTQTDEEATLEVSRAGENLVKEEKSLTPSKKVATKKKAKEEVEETPATEETTEE
nr:MAG TPA: hypothetical protein [Caudoviricetes sp.]DAY34042.1 MAG TPA: hypothetical protein [Caudoviricetes sp.]